MSNMYVSYSFIASESNGCLFVPVMVEIGLADNMNVEIISGLNEWDEVFLGYETLSGDSYVWGKDVSDTLYDYCMEQDKVQQRFLGGIAAISLAVGGIDIMNIMLVTVTERTREIGIRKAIGAERKSIIAQFLIEACMLCGIEGIFGIIVGYVGTLVVGKQSFGIILIPEPSVAVGAFGISVALGIVFGLYPAIKASGLQPVDALRTQ